MKITFNIAFAVAFMAFNNLQAQSPAESDIYGRLVGHGNESVSALETVLKASDNYSTAVLFMGSAVAYRLKQLDDSAFLMYIAEIRVQFDHALFPPTGTDDNDPVQTFAALQQQLGGMINPAIMQKPKLFAKVLARVKAWTPKVSENYNPGWEFSKKESANEGEAALKNAKKEFLKTMDGLCTLLQDNAYFAAFKTSQDYNLKSSGKPSKQAYDAAVQTMKRIEKEKGIYGFATNAG